MCFLARIPKDGLPEDVEERISALLQKSRRNKSAFTARPSEDVGVRNCSQLPRAVQTAIVKKVVDTLLEADASKNTFVHSSQTKGSAAFRTWRRGGSVHLSELIKLLTAEEMDHLRAQNGGLQTLLKNHHQVFIIREGRAQLRDWPAEKDTFVRKAKGKQHNRCCWFHAHHPDGCPFTSETCAFRHSAENA